MTSSRNASATSDAAISGLAPLAGMLRELPAPKTLHLEDMKIPSITCRCGRTKKITQMVRTTTPMVKNVCTDVCTDCPNVAEHRKEDATLARFVCVGCGSLIARVPPHENKETKLRISAGKTYHTLGCPHCRREVREAMVELQRVNSDPNKDVEFEAKILEILLVTNPNLARQCLAKILSPSL